MIAPIAHGCGYGGRASSDHRAPYSAAQYARRLAAVRAAIAARGVELLFVEDPSNMAWLSGYEGWSFYVPQGVLVFHDAGPLWWGREQDASDALRTVWMDAARVTSHPDRYVQAPDRHPMQLLAATIRSQGHGAARIGVEMDCYYFSAGPI